MGIKLHTMPIIWCDILSAGSLASNPVYHARTKHIEVDVYFIRDKILTRVIKVRYVSSNYQVANVLIKVLSTQRFQIFRDKLHVFSTPSSLRGNVREISLEK